jgi:hypothetical protein
MATPFGIYFAVFTQMEDEPTVKTTPFTTPVQNLFHFVHGLKATSQIVLALYSGKHGVLLTRKSYS